MQSLILDEVFGEENLQNEIIWKSIYEVRTSAKRIWNT